MDSLMLYLLRSAAYLALFTGVYYMFLRRETFFALNRAFLLGAGALSFLLPLLKIPSPFRAEVFIAPPYVRSGFLQPGSPGPSPDPLLPAAVFAVYLAGAAFLLVRFGVRLVGLLLAARRCGCRPLGGLRVVLCPGRREPFSFFRYVFLDQNMVPGEEFDRILAHELVHVRQRHSLDIVLSELVAMIQWFNPFVWPYKVSLRETHEYLADRAVIAQGFGRPGYQRLIVEQHVGGKLFEYASNFRNSQIKRRLTMMSRPCSRGAARLKVLLSLPPALLLVLALAEPRIAVSSGVPEVAADASQEAATGKEKTEEDAAAKLKVFSAKLEQAKAENAANIAKLKEACRSTQDPVELEKCKKALQEEKLVGDELAKKEKLLHMKKLELALEGETDPARKDKLLSKLKEFQQQAGQPAPLPLEAKQHELLKMIKHCEETIGTETDPAKKDKLLKKCAEMKVQAEVNAKMIQAMKEELKAKSEQEKKND